MNRRTALVAAIALGVASSALAQAPSGLMPVKSRQLDVLQVSPKVAAYKKVLVEPAKAEVQPGWIRSMNDAAGMAGPKVKDADARNIEAEAAKALGPIVADAFKAKGYEIVTAPGPGVMRLNAFAKEIFLNAPDSKAPGVRSVTEDAGTVVLELGATDATSGAPLALTKTKVAVKSGVGGATQASSVSNRYWFGNSFSDWAKAVASEVQKQGAK